MRNVDSAVTQHVMRPERLIHRPVSPDSPDGVTLLGLPAVGVLADATAESPQPIGIRRQSPAEPLRPATTRPANAARTSLAARRLDWIRRPTKVAAQRRSVTTGFETKSVLP